MDSAAKHEGVQVSLEKNNTKGTLSIADALLYLDKVKGEFRDKPEIYNRFLDIMKDFKAQELNTVDVIQQVSILFKGHPKLIQGFNVFLPNGYKIEIDLGEIEQEETEAQLAREFVSRVRDRFASEPNQETYKAFLKALYGFGKGQGGLEIAIDEVLSLFEGHPNLLEEFVDWLPDKLKAGAEKRLSGAVSNE